MKDLYLFSCKRDKLEQKLYLQMRDGKITQADAVRQIYAWFDTYMLKRAKRRR